MYARFWGKTRGTGNASVGERIGEDTECRALAAEVERRARSWEGTGRLGEH